MYLFKRNKFRGITFAKLLLEIIVLYILFLDTETQRKLVRKINKLMLRCASVLAFVGRQVQFFILYRSMPKDI